jgi:hypothetical protein
MKVEVRGAAAKIDAIMRFDKEAWRAVQRGVKEATAAVTKDAQSRVPPMGLIPMRKGAGWGKWIAARDGRDLSYNAAAFKFSTRFQSRSRQGFREVRGRSVLNLTSPAVAIFALAGSQDRSGHKFNANINKQTGTRTGARNVGMWPRLLTPAYYAKGPEASATIGRLIEQAVQQANR